MDLSSALTVSGWFMQVIFDKCLSSALRAYNSDPNLPEALERLQDVMKNIRSLLPLAQRFRDENQGLHDWLSDLKVAAYDADDLFDELHYNCLHQQQQHQHQQQDHITSSQMSSDSFGSMLRKAGVFLSDQLNSVSAMGGDSITNHPQPRSTLASCDRGIVDRTNEIARRLERINSGLRSVLTLLKLEDIAPNPPSVFTVSDRVTTSMLQSEHCVFGRDTERNLIIEMLVSNRPAATTPTDRVSVIPIVGMGGVGKTTLAQLVYNHQQVKEHFQHRIWVCVSDNFDVAKLTREMLECVGVDASPHRNTNLNRLQVALREKLSSERFLLVLDDVWNDWEKKKWETLCAPLGFGKTGSRILITTRLDTVASIVGKVITDTMASIKLEGLPEAEYWSLFTACAFGGEYPGNHSKLVVIGRHIAKKLKGSPLAAKTVGGLLREKLDDEYWRNILESGIWELPQSPDDIMPALRLSYQHLPAHLQKCFAYCGVFPKDWAFKPNELVAMWMAQGYIDQATTSTGGKKRPEDIGREYWISLQSRSFFQLVQRGRAKKYFVLVLHDLLHDLAESVSSDECFRVDGNSKKLKEIPNTVRHLFAHPDNLAVQIKMFSNLRNLRTLIIPGEVEDYDALRSLFNKLRSIRVLYLLDHNLLPNNIGHLIHLRFLNLPKYAQPFLPDSLCKLYHLQWFGRIRGKVTLPTGMNNLVSLRHCFVPSVVFGMMGGIGKLACLQELQSFTVGLKEEGREIGQLKNLKELRGTLKLYHLENVFSKEAALEAMLNQKEHIHGMELCWSDITTDNAPPAEVVEEVLEGLQPPPYIKHLTIESYRGVESPAWMHLAANQYNCGLSHLECLHLVRCTKWKDLPVLGQLPFLRYLEIAGAHTMVEIGSPGFYGSTVDNTKGYCFRSLEVLKFKDMPKWVEWNGFNQQGNSSLFPRLRKLTIEYCPRLERVSKVLQHMVSLQKIKIRSCSSLQSLQGELKNLPSLERLIVECCYKLKSLPHVPVSLQVLRVAGCLELLTIFNEEQEETLSELTSLRELDIRFCPHLWSMPSQLKTLPSLKKFTVKYCNKLQPMPLLPASLEELIVDGCPELLTLLTGAVQEENLLELTSLRKLDIQFCINLHSLPAELKSLPSLKRLMVRDCVKLHSLPLLPASLVFLIIERCLQLPRERYHEGGDDWRNIDHVPEILWI